LAIIASGAIAKVETVRAWTLPEFKEIMEKVDVSQPVSSLRVRNGEPQ
jgi:hypothetical protein